MFDPISLGAVGLMGTSNLANTFLQWRNYEYQKSLQNKIFSREDSSITRRVADLKNAGLSPVLAAGQGAGTGGVVSTNAPQFNPDSAMIMAGLKMESDISKTNKEKELIDKQMQSINASIGQTLANTANTNQDTYRKFLENRIKKLESDIALTTGNPGKSSAGKMINEGTGIILKAGESVNKGWQWYNNEAMKVQRKIEENFNNLKPHEQLRKYGR